MKMTQLSSLKIVVLGSKEVGKSGETALNVSSLSLSLGRRKFTTMSFSLSRDIPEKRYSALFYLSGFHVLFVLSTFDQKIVLVAQLHSLNVVSLDVRIRHTMSRVRQQSI